ncbi:MAG: hypothetical protein IPK76_05895 [Lewinellaceae bacterium]|nr:hypothetical protein [Lewinellaceae bacterium]
MKSKILNALLILSSLVGYLEWGKDNKLFLFQAEAEIISKLIDNPLSVLHPFTVLPFVGQILLLITLFQQKPGRILTYVGIGGIGILLALMFVIGLITLNVKVLASTIPFLVLAFVTIRHHRAK